MQKANIPTPFLYGDHHVLEVRKILLALPGVVDVYASSCFHLIEVDFNPDQISVEDLYTRLEEAGYLAELPMMDEQGENKPNRRTAIVEQTLSAVAFQQDVPRQKGASIPCPGMGLLKIERGKNG